MKKIIDYEILSAFNLIELKEVVCSYIAEDWQPQGGLSITRGGGQVYYIQVMVKYED
jgi:hypothetical protein